MKAIIIARVSTEEQKEAGNSLPAQISRMERYCSINKLEILKAFSFDESAYKTKREDFDVILDFVINQREKVSVCFDKVDRLSRNIFDKRVTLLYEKALKDEVELHFVSDGQIINSRISAVEKFNFSMSLGLSKYFSDAISDNVKRAQEQMLRTGVYPAKPPYGYIRRKISEEKTDIFVDEFKSKVVHKAYELYSTRSYSLDSLRSKIKELFGVDWAHGFIDKILKDKFYYGIMTWKKKEWPHKYSPLITEALFNKVQAIKASFHKKKFKYAGLPYIYRGMLRCGHCGLAITPEKHKGHVYYHCTQYNGKHDAEWLREEHITEQLGYVFKNLKIPDEVYDQILDNLKKTHESKIEFCTIQRDALLKEREVYQNRLDKSYIDKLDGRITESQYDGFYQTFREKVSEIDTRLSMLQEADDNYYVTTRYLLELTKRAYELFESSEVEQKRQLIHLVLQNVRVEGNKVCYDLIKPFDVLVNANEHQLWLRGKDSNL